MGLHGDGIKQGIQDTFGESVYKKADLLKDDYNDGGDEVAVVEDANLTVYMMTYSKLYASSLKSLEVKICQRLRRYLYDPVTKKRNKVSFISWVFDDGAPINKQTTQNKRNLGKGYTKGEAAAMWLSGEIQELFENRDLTGKEIDLEKIRSTRCFFPLLVKYISKFIVERLTPTQLVSPGDNLVTIRVVGAIQQLHLFVEPVKNCGSIHWRPLQQTDFEGNIVFTTNRLSYTKTIGYNNSFSYSPRIEGEAEITLMSECKTLYSQMGFRDFYIVCDDTDIIPISLLSYDRFLPQSKVLVVLDEATAQFRPKERIMDVADTISLVNKYFEKNLPQLKNPVVFLCLWMALMGSDYVEHVAGLSGTLFFNGFMNKELFDYLRGLNTEDVEKLIIITPDGFAINEDLTIGMLLEYHMNYPESSQKKPDVQQRIKLSRPTTVEEVYRITTHGGKRKVLSKTTDDMYAHVRRAAWQLNYWLIGPTGFDKVWDPMLMKQREMDGLNQEPAYILDSNLMKYVPLNNKFVSLYGYAFSSNGELARARVVYRQKKN